MMKKYLNEITWVLLVSLIFVSYTLTDINNESTRWVLPLILVLSMMKFIGVSFVFMEIKNANIAWKIILSVFITAFVSIIAFI
ncbi:MAG: hypothetical protein GXO88_01705 [Chlorobi bacterium]|nr:hypothetical protein [Chlorobiota bacterium]